MTYLSKAHRVHASTTRKQNRQYSVEIKHRAGGFARECQALFLAILLFNSSINPIGMWGDLPLIPPTIYQLFGHSE